MKVKCAGTVFAWGGGQFQRAGVRVYGQVGIQEERVVRPKYGPLRNRGAFESMYGNFALFLDSLLEYAQRWLLEWFRSGAAAE